MSDVQVESSVFSSFLTSLATLANSAVDLHNNLITNYINQETEEVTIDKSNFTNFHEKLCDLHIQMSQIGVSGPAYDSVLYSELEGSLKSEIGFLSSQISSQELNLSQMSQKQRNLEQEFGVFKKNRSMVDNSLETDLPSNYEKMEFLLVQYRERIIQLAEANERLRLNHANEIESMRSAHLIDRNENVLLVERKYRSEMEKMRMEMDEIGTIACLSHVPGRGVVSGEVIEAVREMIARDKEKLREAGEEIRDLERKLGFLRTALEDAEIVQRDFVGLTQRLQIENSNLKEKLGKFIDD